MGVNDQLQLPDKIPRNTLERRLVGPTVRRYAVPTTKSPASTGNRAG